MNGSIVLIAGIAGFINFAVIYYKWDKGQTTSASLDALILALTFWLFSGTLGALAIGVISSALFSIFLIAKPPREGIFDDW